MTKGKSMVIASSTVLLIIFFLGIAGYFLWSDIRTERSIAPDFIIDLPYGNQTSLRHYSGAPVLLHFTNIENPICIECEKELKEQTLEIEKAKEEKEDLTIITINMRKNQYSDPGYELVREWWGVNVSWIWIEDPDPFPISGDYIDYWSIGSESANPTLLLLDREQFIVGTYHVYQMGKGEVDGVLEAEEIVQKVEKIESGDWEGVEGQRSSMGGGSVIGMFLLGIITSFSPCSIALLFTVFSFIVSSRKKEGAEPQGNYEKGLSTRDGFLIGTSFVLGMALVFFVLGIFIAEIGVFLQGARYFDLGAGAILGVLGSNNLFSFTEHLGNLRDKIVKGKAKKKKMNGHEDGSLKESYIMKIKGIFSRSPVLGSFLLGVFFSLGWAPCAISLVLPVVVWILSQDISTLMGGFLFFVFGIGHGLLFVPLAVGTSSFSGRLTQRFMFIGKWVRIVFGILVVVMGFIFAARFFGLKMW